MDLREKLSALFPFVSLLSLFAVGCSRAPSSVSGPLPQRGYLWQRDWTPAVSAALAEAQRHLQGVVLLGAEVEWSAKEPRVVRANINWKQVRGTAGGRCALALRVAPFAFPQEPNDQRLRALTTVARSLLAEAQAQSVSVTEFQFDYDCAQRNLGTYRDWLHEFRQSIRPARFVITTLPAWLDEPAFNGLVHEADAFVLQTHSVPLAGEVGGSLCDTLRARRWVKQAARLHEPFSVALPTYRCTGGYDRSGHLIGVAMDGIQPAWPPGTHVLDFFADANALAGLVKEWQQHRPPELRELLWYRVPVATDLRNWRWPTLRAVMSGRKPVRRIAVEQRGDNPIDLTLVNEGETDDDIRASVEASWTSDKLLAADALAGWEVEAQPRRASFSVAEGHHLRLPPGARRRIGWLREEGKTAPTLTYRDEPSFTR